MPVLEAGAGRRGEAPDFRHCEHIRELAEHGRIAWQRKYGYGLRSYAELAIQSYKHIFRGGMKARALPRQKTKACVSASALNTMANLGMPVSAKI